MGTKSHVIQSISSFLLLWVHAFSATAQLPWAVEAMGYAPGTTALQNYDLKGSALGRPTVDTYEDIFAENPKVTVVPVFSAWDATEVVSIGEGGSLVLRLGEPLSDDPAHPYGVDLLLFSYTFIEGGGLYDQQTQDPSQYTLPNTQNIRLYSDQKTGKVEVSADNITWFAFPADQDLVRLLPTLGRVWAGSAWGAPTDPTFPPHPDLLLTDLAGMNLADLCRRYRGGAGGTGFDLADLDNPGGSPLPSDFHYVRISVPDDNNATTSFRIEIDAVTVVSPVEAYTRWTQKEFSWTGDPDVEVPEANPDTDGFSNWEEFGRGGNPKQSEPALWLPEVQISATALGYRLPGNATEAPWVLQTSDNIADSESWQDISPQPSAQDTPDGNSIDRTLPLSDSSGFYRLRLEEAP